MKITNSRTKIKVVCLSAHLREGAKGHLHQYHKSLHNLLDKHFDVVYFGGEDTHQNSKQNWFSPVLPKSLSKPSPRVSSFWLKGFLKKTTRITTGPCLFYIYEGSIYWLILALKILQKNSSCVIVVNLFNSRKTVDRLTGRDREIWIRLYKWILGEGNGRILLAADNQKFFSKLLQIFPDMFVNYIPVIPSLTLETKLIGNPSDTIILIRGEYGKKILRIIAPHIKNSPGISVHGLDRGTLNEIGLIEAKVSTGGLKEREYKDKYNEYSSCVFLYDISDFEYQSSGRFVDAHFAGIPTLVPASTAMAEEFPDCSLVVRFNEDNYISIVDFIRNPPPLLKHSCDSLLLKVKDEFESIVHNSRSIADESLETSRPKRLSAFLIMNLMNVWSWLTMGGTLNLLALLDRLGKIRKNFRKFDYLKDSSSMSK
jgi:hypothetical protein